MSGYKDMGRKNDKTCIIFFEYFLFVFQSKSEFCLSNLLKKRFALKAIRQHGML